MKINKNCLIQTTIKYHGKQQYNYHSLKYFQLIVSNERNRIEFTILPVKLMKWNEKKQIKQAQSSDLREAYTSDDYIIIDPKAVMLTIVSDLVNSFIYSFT